MKITYKELLQSLIVGFVAFLLLTFLNKAFGNTIVLDELLAIQFLYTVVFVFAIMYANKYLFHVLSQFFDKDKFTLKRLIVGLLSSFVVTLSVIFLLRIFEDVVIGKNSFSQFWSKENTLSYIVIMVITFIAVLLFNMFYYYKIYNENRVKEQKIIAGTASAKFESLKNQIDPHFLFNSLNVLSSLIEENPQNAQRFTISLSKIYRYVLEQKDKELVSLEEELSFAKTYMNLLKMRFENSLFYELPEIATNSDVKVIPLSLQLLLENTVKHNVVSEKKPLHIRIFVEDNYLAIQNDFQKKEVLQDRQGVGLQNIINRYGIITNRKVLIIQTEQTFTVKIPILTKQITIMEATASYNENFAYLKAKKQVDKIKGFYGSLISYCLVMPFLIFINLRTSSGYQWFWFPLLGWGFGLVMKGLKVYGYGSNWEERKIQEILRKEEQRQNWK
jgi:sensor histidine kinase YesM